jgi:geranylgeranyl pyrophosphate synthase
MGVGFQIYDDYLGMTSSEEVLGKSVGNDIREGKKTLIVIRGLQTPAGDDILQLLGKKRASDSELTRLVDRLNEEGVLDYARKKAESYILEAKSKLMVLPPSKARDLLTELADYAIVRKK